MAIQGSAAKAKPANVQRQGPATQRYEKKNAKAMLLKPHAFRKGGKAQEERSTLLLAPFLIALENSIIGKNATPHVFGLFFFSIWCFARYPEV